MKPWPQILSASCLFLCLDAAALAAPDNLRSQLEALAAGHGFAIEGLGRIGAEPASPAQGTPAEQIKALLQDYNYLLVQARPGVIEKVLITSRKVADGKKSADSAYIGTVRLGAHHQVAAALAGPNAVAKNVALLVDTGASTLVLPSSMIAELGFAPENLRDGLSQTASGTEPVKIGTLRSVRVGAVSADNVEVSFIADAKLQGAMLLGMSFLRRFRVTIDDAKNELILLAK